MRKRQRNIYVFAHRGASGYCPENTMAAFSRAVELGANAIETDVQLTADGVPVLIHDETVDRTTDGKGAVKSLGVEAIRRLDAGAWYGEEFRGERIPLLDELLELGHRTGVFLNIELKNSVEPYPGLEEAVAGAIEKYGMERQVIISSFNHRSLVHFRTIAPDVRTAILYDEAIEEPWRYAEELGAETLHSHKGLLTPDAVKTAEAAGVSCHPWTVNEESELRAMLELGVAGIITDYPDRLVRILDEEVRLETRLLSSLAKVFPNREPEGTMSYNRGSALRGEAFAFQVAYRSPLERSRRLRVAVRTELADAVTVRSVGLAPSELPAYMDGDEDVISKEPGLYPDPLFKIDTRGGESFVAYPRQWRSLWVTVDIPVSLASGLYSIEVILTAADGEEDGESLASEKFELDVIEAALPEQRLLHTEWFHCDCLAVHYGVEVFGEAHWTIIGRYLETAVKYGINMILTPLFTPPLDTEVGGERPTVQLVNVIKENRNFRFEFSRLARWIELCSEKGIRYFEMSHLFTQWGAKHAPKIVAEVGDGSRRIFGWETDASGEGYEMFLRAFLPELIAFLREKGIAERCYFHVSDEPNLSHLDSYSRASALLTELLPDYPIIDALSDYAFYERGLVRKPIPANDHIAEFAEGGVEGLWTYYCCLQDDKVSNRFFNMPSARNRILGCQLYKFRIEGFLHWGYNFWFTQLSRESIDPYRVTDAGGAFPSGDAFVVYPGKDGSPTASIRLEVFREALQDLRALELLEQLVGRERTVALLEEGLSEPLTFTEMPRDARWLLDLRERVNARIAEAIG